MILVQDVSKLQFDLYTDLTEAAGALNMDRATLRKKLERAPTFYHSNFILVSRDLNIHKSKRGRK